MFSFIFMMLSLVPAHGAEIDPVRLLKANLFGFDAKIEKITGALCEEDLSPIDQLVNELGLRLYQGSSDHRMGAIMENAYNDELFEQRSAQQKAAIGGQSHEEIREKLKSLIPSRIRYNQGALRGEQAVTTDFLVHLVSEFTKWEKASMVNRAITHLERAIRHDIQMKIWNRAGDEGRAFRLIRFLEYMAKEMNHDQHEAAFKKFADAFLTENILRLSLSEEYIENTHSLLRFLHEKNYFLYLYFMEKYQPYSAPDNPTDESEGN